MMTRYHHGFAEGGSVREKRKFLNDFLRKLKESNYRPHPFDIVGIDAAPRTIRNYPLEVKQR
jgi:hypothetical protein